MTRMAAALALAGLAGACVGPGSGAPVAGQAAAAAPIRLPPPPELVDAARLGLTAPLVQGGVALGTAPAGVLRLSLDGIDVPVDRDGRFLIGFDRDAPPRALLVAAMADGRTLSAPLTVRPGAWAIERLDSVARVPVPDADFARRRPAELARIAAARAVASDAAGWRQRFAWPLTGRISGRFGAQRVYRGQAGSYHSGVDIARPTGAVVAAPADGVVTLAAATPFTLEGRLLMIDHGHGLNSAFLHLSRIDVTVGQRVRQGQAIGRVGMTGRASGPHLHWGMTWRGARVDPAGVAGDGIGVSECAGPDSCARRP